VTRNISLFKTGSEGKIGINTFMKLR